MVVLRKTIRVMKGQQFLFDQPKSFFHLTNLPKRSLPKQRIVAESNSRCGQEGCDQENIIAQGKAMGALSAPLHDLTSNWAYMVMAMLGWNFSISNVMNRVVCRSGMRRSMLL